jgi:[ribosomal protein S5]-alanine N-acetyltransferase
MRSDPTRLQLSLYAFPDELRVDELWLHAPRDEDVDRIAPAFRDPAVGGEAGLPPVGASELRVMMREMLPGMRLAGMLSPYVIEDSRAGDLLGGLTLHHFDSMRDSVEVGFWLFREARGRGVATRAVRAAAEHALANGIHRVEAHVRLGNPASERVLERVGFEREGVKRRYLRHEGLRVDATLFALLADD